MTIYSTGHRKLCIVGGVVVGIVVVALALGLGLGLGLKTRSSSNYVATNSTVLLDPSFDITSTPTTRYYEWVVEEMSGAPDGFERTMLVVNGERIPKSIAGHFLSHVRTGQFPGPLIEVNSGDELIVNVFNEMSNGTTIHWHGQLQNGTNYMDGTNGITQCPIPPGMNFSEPIPTYSCALAGTQGTILSIPLYHQSRSVRHVLVARTRLDSIYGRYIWSPRDPFSQ